MRTSKNLRNIYFKIAYGVYISIFPKQKESTLSLAKQYFIRNILYKNEHALHIFQFSICNS